MANVETPTESDILSRIIEPSKGRLDAGVADVFLRFRFAESDVERMNELAERNRRGEATDEELEEMERYSRVGNLLNLLKSKARLSTSDG